MSLAQQIARLADLFGGNQNGYGVPYSNRNLFVDGNKDVWSGTTAALGTSGNYTVNVLQAGSAGAGGAGTYSQNTFAVGSATLNGFARPVKYYGTHAQTSASTGSLSALTCPLLYRLVEDVSSTEGAALTLSIWLWVSTGTLNITQAFVGQNFGTGGSPSAAVNTLVPVNWTLTTTPQRFSVLINVPGITGKTIGTTTPGSTLFGVCPPVGSTYTIGDAQWQLEYCSPNASTSITGNGGAPTTFEYRGQQAELARVQRYYQFGNFAMGGYSPASAVTMLSDIALPVTMRAAPTCVITAESLSTGMGSRSIGADGTGAARLTGLSGSNGGYNWAGTFTADSRL